MKEGTGSKATSIRNARGEKKKTRRVGKRGGGGSGGYVHVGVGVLPGGGGRESARAAGDGARCGELDDARVVPCCVCAGVREVGTPVDERERAAHVGHEEVLRRRGVRADGAQCVREGDHVGGWLRAGVAAATATVDVAGAA